MSENNAIHVGSVFAAFSVGALAGVALALLYAPRSGQETRDLIADKGRELKDKAQETMHEAQDFIGDKKSAVVAAIKAGKEALCEERATQQRNSEIANHV